MSLTSVDFPEPDTPVTTVNRPSGNFLRLAFGDQVPAGVSRAGTEIDDKIGAADGVLVVFDHKNGIAEIAELLERMQQAIVIARVEADGRLVQNVEDAAKA